MLWTIETACGGSLSRAPETHPVPLHLLQSPPMGRTAIAFFKWCRGWLPVPLVQVPQDCESWEAVVRDRTLGSV
ncbi:hypothetical protein KAM481_38560 [Aeromonas caviae]|nr:hypothetical protein KAM643c_45060 [Aeromonas caviae]GKR80386.1 hypothetical protein KAM481_38560 [Aeromonas caviae]